MALVEDFETTIKIIVVGNGGVGKSSMIRRFCTGEYTDKYKKTIGVDFLEKEQYVKSVDQTITFMVWDTAGQEEFNALTRQYYRNANGCVLAFSTVDKDSFDAVERWKEKVEAECGEIAMVLVQNKVDLIDKAVVTSEEVEAKAKKLKLKLYRTCVSENLNVDKVFEFLGEAYVSGSKEQGESGTGQGGMATIGEMGITHAGTKPQAPSTTQPTVKPQPQSNKPQHIMDDDQKEDEGATEPPKNVQKENPAPPPPAKNAANKDKKKDVVNLKPKQRTGGKKKWTSNCSIL